MAASFEELCAEPKLLDNLLLCLNPEKLLQEARAARAKASSSSGLGPVGSEAEAEELSRNAAMAVSTMLLVSCCRVDMKLNKEWGETWVRKDASLCDTRQQQPQLRA
jgi:hypothetical protein